MHAVGVRIILAHKYAWVYLKGNIVAFVGAGILNARTVNVFPVVLCVMVIRNAPMALMNAIVWRTSAAIPNLNVNPVEFAYQGKICLKSRHFQKETNK